MPATPAPGTLKKGKKGSETHSLRHVDDAVGAPEAHLLVNSLAPEKHRPSPSPAAYLSHPWLTEGHVGALLAEAMGHHPEWSNVWNRVSIDLVTHDLSGISSLDQQMAERIDAMAAG